MRRNGDESLVHNVAAIPSRQFCVCLDVAPVGRADKNHLFHAKKLLSDYFERSHQKGILKVSSQYSLGQVMWL